MSIIEKLGISKSPWKAARDDCHFDSLSDIVDSDDKLICQSTGYSVDVMQKDCLLMASAPEMLEALIDEWFFIDKFLSVWADSIDCAEYHKFNQRAEIIVCLVEKATGKSWEQIKELL